MRNRYAAILRGLFHENLLRDREALGISQEEMGRRLSMSCRSYVDLDHGKSNCSAVTLALYLAYISPDPKAFLDEFRKQADLCCEQEYIPAKVKHDHQSKKETIQ